MIVSHMPIEKISPDDGGQYWIGYYDKQAWSLDGSRVLMHRSAFFDRFPSASESCQIGTIIDAHFEPAATTRAWNWQQGAHLRWNAVGGHEALMFNDLDELGHAISRWVLPDGKQVHEIGSPIYALAPDGASGLTLSFGRLSRLRPEYGYPALSDAQSDVPAPDDDGIWRVDLATGERTMLVSIADLARVGAGSVDLKASDAPHQHVNHIMVDPSSSRCCFLHRYERDDGILQSRLFTIGLDGSGLRLLMEGMVSHYDWLDSERIIAWGGKRKLLGSGNTTGGGRARVMSLARRTLKPMYYAMGKPRFLMNRVMGDSYLVLADRPDSEINPFAKGELTCDGHNTLFRGCDGVEGGRWMVTDGYPDLRSRQPLYLWDLHSNKGYEIGRFSTPRSLDGAVRVDLHPRFSRDAKWICIDSAMENTRSVYQVDISSIIENNRSAAEENP